MTVAVKTRLRRGLYAITDHELLGTGIVAAVADAIRGGASLIQYRDKSHDKERRDREAVALSSLCHQHDVPLIVNDDIDLAGRSGAHGVHLGKSDASVADARRQLGPDAIIGVSCYNDLDIALRAQQEGADYVAFGSFFASPTKPRAVRAEMSLLREAETRLDIPVVAIGGISADNGARLVEAGADLLAVISEVFGGEDIAASAARFARLFAQTSR